LDGTAFVGVSTEQAGLLDSTTLTLEKVQLFYPVDSCVNREEVRQLRDKANRLNQLVDRQAAIISNQRQLIQDQQQLVEDLDRCIADQNTLIRLSLDKTKRLENSVTALRRQVCTCLDS